MSVLFKALSRASEQNRLRQPGAAAHPIPVMQGAAPQQSRWRLLFLSSVALLGLMGAGGLWLGTTAEDGGSASAGAVAPPAAEAAPETDRQPEPMPPPTEAAEAAEAAPVPSEPAAATATVTAPAVAALAPPTAPAPPHAAPVPEPPPADQVAPGADLPSVLESIRRRSLGKAAGAPVVVRQQAAAAASPGLSVEMVQTSARDDVAAAYDALVAGRYEKALSLYDDALGKEPRNVTALVGRASVLHKLGRLQEAREGYGRVLAAEPEHPQALANVLSLIAGSAPQEALRELARLKALNPRFSPIPAQMAAVHAQAGDLPQAMAAMTEAIALSPGNAVYRYNLAVLQDRAGLRREAVETYESVIAAGGSSAAAAALPLDQIRARVKYLREAG